MLYQTQIHVRGYPPWPQVAYRASVLHHNMRALSDVGLPLGSILHLVREELQVMIGAKPDEIVSRVSRLAAVLQVSLQAALALVIKQPNLLCRSGILRVMNVDFQEFKWLDLYLYSLAFFLNGPGDTRRKF